MLNVGNMVFEVTRRCNMKCHHCLRGNCQRLDMSPQTIWNALKYVDSIGTITITGGEPSLKPEAIKELWSILVRGGTHVSYFYVVTNAKSTYRRREFLAALDRLHQWCDEPEGNVLCVSQDQFHNELRKPNMKDYDTVIDEFGYDLYGYEREYFKPEDRRHPIINVIDDGRAHELGWGTSEKEEQKPWQVCKYNEHISVQEEVVYISANGNVTSNCDMSFKRIDEESQGNVNNESLEEIILRNCKGEDEDKMSGEPTPKIEEVNA